jgi:hypothetical protein
MPPSNRLDFNPTPRQDRCFEHLIDDTTRSVLYGGA